MYENSSNCIIGYYGGGCNTFWTKTNYKKEHYLNEYILNNMNDSGKISKVIKTDAFALLKDGMIVAYSYLHPDLLNNIKR